MAFSVVFSLTFLAYMLIFPREGKKHKGRRKPDHDGMRKEFGGAALRSFGEGGMPGEGGRIGPDRGGGSSNGGGSRARPLILIYSIHLVCFMISSLQACFIRHF
jgi:hypothetical protein